MQRALQRSGRERDADVAREALLDAASEVFARDGFSGGRMDDIARVAGYNKALIFHYFGDKLGLYRALMSRTKASIFARFNAAFELVSGDGDESVSAHQIRTFTAECLRVLFDFYIAHPQAARIVAWEAAEGWQTFAHCAPPTPENWSERTLSLLERAQRSGVVRVDLDPQLLFTTVMSLPLIHVISLTRFQMMFPNADFTSPEALTHAREQLTELVLRGTLIQPEEA
ncbi:MAG: TetR/AcrR family transcriptional regulator [Ktedonobacterales bacterium]